MKYRERPIAWLCFCAALCALLALRMRVPLGIHTGGRLLAIFAVLALIPLAPWPKRFSLRDLFTATTLLAVMLGVIALLARK
jgi:hypothetical protein